MSLAEPNKLAHAPAVGRMGHDAPIARRKKRIHGRGNIVLRGLRAADLAGLALAFFPLMWDTGVAAF